MDPKMFLKVVRYHRVLVGGMLFTPFADVDLSKAL